MANHVVFTDGDGNELKSYINNDGALYIQVGAPGEGVDDFKGYITLNKSDVTKLIEVLTEIENQMDE